MSLPFRSAHSRRTVTLQARRATRKRLSMNAIVPSPASMAERTPSAMPFRARISHRHRPLLRRLHASVVVLVNHVAALRPFGARPHESAMQFAQRGKLSCICMPLRARRPNPERRQICRTCGLEVRVLSRNVDRHLTTGEIRAIERGLRLASIRSAALEIPAGVSTLRQLNAFLASDSLKAAKSESQVPTNHQTSVDPARSAN